MVKLNHGLLHNYTIDQFHIEPLGKINEVVKCYRSLGESHHATLYALFCLS